MKTIQILLLTLLMLPTLLSAQEDEGVGEPNEVAIAVNQVPEHVLETARKARPGAYFTQALRQLRRDEVYYRLYASQVGRYWVVVVRQDGVLDRVFESPSAPQPLAGS